MLERILRWILSNPKNTLTIIGGITVLWALFIPNLKIDFTIEHLFSKNDPAVERYFSFRDTFGREDNVITIIYEPYDALQKDLYIELEELVYKIDELTEVKDVLSLFSLSDIDLNAWIGDLYNENTQWNKDTVLQKLKYIQADPSIGARVLSKDLKYGAIILTLSDRANNHKDRTDLIEKIKIFTEQTSPDWIFSGVSVLRTEYVKYMLRDNIVFLPPIALILISILSYIFRSWVFVLLPIMTVIITVIWLLGFMGLVGLEINIMTYVVPTLLFIIGISDAIHIQARFRENMSKDNSDPEKAMFLTMTQMSKVILLTSLTTAIGFIALTTTSIKIVQEFGLEIALGVMIAWFVSILVVPAGIMFFRAFNEKNRYTFSYLLYWLSNTIPKKPWLFIIIPLLISFTMIYKIKDISTDSSLMDDLRPKNKLYQDLKFTEKYFGGVLPFEVLIHIDPDKNKPNIETDILPYLDQVESLLQSEMQESRFFSLSTLLRSIKRIRGDNGDEIYNYEMIERIAQEQSKQGNRLISDDKTVFRVTGLIENRTSSEMKKVYNKLDSLSRSFPPYLSIECTGTTVVALRTNDYLVQSLVNSLGLALFFISIVMAVMFRARSILFASLVTNLIPIFTILGAIAWFGISIRPPTAMTFAVALGIAVDDSLHFLLRYRKELRQGMSRVDAIKSTIINTGSALMITTTILVAGFSVLLFSAFLPTYQFGLLSASMIGVALLCDITLLPALCLVLPNPNRG